MSIPTSELLEAISEVSSIQEMKVTVKVTATCAIIAACSTLVGGLIAGPFGIAAGGLIGTAAAFSYGHGKFKSVPQVLAQDATPEQREKLAKAIRSILNARNILVVAQFVEAMRTDEKLLQDVKLVIRDFLKKAMGYHFNS
ncbi:protein C19orf12 homolog [Phymastichus coffea]|uniref:protein C19orf12 homolog n=1 Tax=Phymastichus coffea TaxID=108790 RepID=UPI00273AC532|nr:protein C19orf12 homolog [Phymastichus coffea]